MTNKTLYVKIANIFILKTTGYTVLVTPHTSYTPHIRPHTAHTSHIRPHTSHIRPHMPPPRYGLSQFVLLSPGEGESALTSQAQANLMISSVSVAVSNTSCVTPVFVQVHQKWRQVYVGVAEGGDLRVDYNMVHLKHTPPHYRHLAGLLELFKGKLVRVLP